MTSASPDDALDLHPRLGAERATRIRRLKRRLAMFLLKGIKPEFLIDMMVELMTLQEEHQESPHE